MLTLLRVPSVGDRVGAIDPPISQGLAAAAVRAEGLEAQVIDLTYDADAGLERLLATLREPGSHVVGMSAYQTNIERCRSIARTVRAVRPDAHVLLGGPQATHMPIAGLAEMPEIDALCRGPAEAALPAFLRSLADGDGAYFGFLARREGRAAEFAPLPGARAAAPASPFLQALWPLDRYPFVVMFSSRGCPYGCAFCYTPASSGRKVSYEPLERVFADVAAVAAAGMRHVFFADPIFIVDRRRTLALVRGLERFAADGMTFSCELRVEHVDAELLGAMARARFVKVAYGLESANEAVLERVRKPMRLPEFRATVEATLAHGIAAEVFYMYGLPDETFDDVLRTYEFVASLPPVVGRLSEPQQMQLYFGTEVLRNSERFGIEILGKRAAYLSPGKSYRTRHLCPDQFADLEERWSSMRSVRSA